MNKFIIHIPYNPFVLSNCIRILFKTAISISSPNSFRYVVEENNKKTFYGIEDGIKPDIDFKYENFYNDSELIKAVNKSND